MLGFTVLNIGALIHVLLIVALAVLIYQLITGRRVA
ncbi:MAG TPA: lmo0937 family membrane protein [Thermomicrobiales bacterium]